MLSNTPYDWSECLLELPVNSIIKHVEQHNSLVPDANIAVSLKLNEELLDPVKAIFIICNLSHK